LGKAQPEIPSSLKALPVVAVFVGGNCWPWRNAENFGIRGCEKLPYPSRCLTLLLHMAFVYTLQLQVAKVMLDFYWDSWEGS
jgi:hypothetical protein